jgi:hypothetical protein
MIYYFKQIKEKKFMCNIRNEKKHYLSSAKNKSCADTYLFFPKL